MFYLKTQMPNGGVAKTEITDENVYTRCPDCGRELPVDLVEVFSDGKGDLYSTSIICSACTKQRGAKRTHLEGIPSNWPSRVPARAQSNDLQKAHSSRTFADDGLLSNADSGMSLPSDLPSLSTAAWLSGAERRRVTAIARLLNQLLTESSAVITSADTLLTELFSHRGENADSLADYVYMHRIFRVFHNKGLFSRRYSD